MHGNWQDYYWQDASRGHSAIAELLLVIFLLLAYPGCLGKEAVTWVYCSGSVYSLSDCGSIVKPGFIVLYWQLVSLHISLDLEVAVQYSQTSLTSISLPSMVLQGTKMVLECTSLQPAVPSMVRLVGCTVPLMVVVALMDILPVNHSRQLETTCSQVQLFIPLRFLTCLLYWLNQASGYVSQHHVVPVPSQDKLGRLWRKFLSNCICCLTGNCVMVCLVLGIVFFNR